MSSGKELQAMEEDVKQSKTAVNANAAPAQPMEKLTTGGTPPTVEDLGGPSPENYSPTNGNNDGMPGLERGVATTKTWTNGTGSTTTKIELSKTFTNLSTNNAAIAESGLFNSTTIKGSGMLAHKAFSAVTLTTNDSITITWTFTVGN